MAIVEEQQFCLRWNNFQANITSQFETLRDDEDFVDVTLACDGQRFEAHKVVLSACSPFFKELFKSNPCTHPIIFMRDVDARHIVALLEFMYAGEVNVAQAHLSGFLRTAESLQIRGLTDASKVQKDNKLHKDNDNHKHNNTSENANEHTKPSNNSTSQTNFSSYDRSRKCESPPPQPRSHTPSTQNDDIVVHHDKIKISRPIAQCSPPPPKRVCKTESLLIGDDMENSKTQFDMTLSPSSTNNSNLNNHYINQAEIHTELDLTADMIEPKTEPDYQSDGEQDHVERSLDETMLGFEGSETGNSFGVVQGTMELMPGSNMDLCQDSNQGPFRRTTSMKQNERLDRQQSIEDSWLPLALDMSGSGGINAAATMAEAAASQANLLTKLAASNWRTTSDTQHSMHHRPRTGGVIKLGEGIEICEEQLRSVKWSDYRKLTRGLATILFSPLELATCSVTGQRWSRAGTVERPVKPALDRAKVQAIISYVAARFPLVEVSRIKQVLAYKCKENSTAFKMKAVRYFGDQHLKSLEDSRS